MISTCFNLCIPELLSVWSFAASPLYSIFSCIRRVSFSSYYKRRLLLHFLTSFYYWQYEVRRVFCITKTETYDVRQSTRIENSSNTIRNEKQYWRNLSYTGRVVHGGDIILNMIFLFLCVYNSSRRPGMHLQGFPSSVKIITNKTDWIIYIWTIMLFVRCKYID